MIRITTLGGLAIDWEGSPDGRAPPAHGKRGAFLAYLAVERPPGEPHSRDTLLAVFWPESDDRRARDALKQLTRSIRRDLGDDFLLSRGNGLVLDAARVRCDAPELLEASARGDHERVLELYRGDFLEGFHLTGSVTFEEWVTRQHLKLRDATVSAAQSLVERLEIDGELEAAIGVAQRVVELRPYDESGLRTLVRLLLEAGEPGRAVAAFEGYRERLATELRASPSVETVSLVEQARRRVVVERAPDAIVIGAPGPMPTRPAGVTHARPRLSGRSWALAGLVGILVLTGGALAFGSRSTGAVGTLDKSRVLVSSFVNQTGDDDLDYVAQLAADRVGVGLADLSFAEVVTKGYTPRSRRGEALFADPRLSREAREAGAGTVVAGAFALSGDSLRFDAVVLDAATGELFAQVPVVLAPRGAINDAVERLQDGVYATVGARLDPRMELWSRNASRPKTAEAYRAFSEALRVHTAIGEYATTRRLFWAVYEVDTTFTMSALWAGLAAENSGRQAWADSVYSSLFARSSTLPPVDRYFLDYLWNPKPPRQLWALSRLLEFAPGSEYAALAAGAAFRSRLPAEALKYAASVDPPVGWLRGQPRSELTNASALESLRRCEELAVVAERAADATASRWGDLQEAMFVRLMSEACDGDARGFQNVIDEYVAELPRVGGFGYRPLGGLPLATQMLLAHDPDDPDDTVVVHDVAGRLLEYLDEEPRLASSISELLASAGEEESALEVLEHVRALPRERTPWVEPWILAILYARRGEGERAERLLREATEAHAIQEPTRDPDCHLCIGVLRAHQGDLQEAMTHLRQVDFDADWWHAHHRPFIYGPLMNHAPFRELIDPVG